MQISIHLFTVAKTSALPLATSRVALPINNLTLYHVHLSLNQLDDRFIFHLLQISYEKNVFVE